MGEPRQEARTAFLLGAFQDALEDPPQAVASYRQALALWRRLGDPAGTAAALFRLGSAHQNLGENAQALAALEEALTLRQRLGQRVREAETRNQLCLALQRSGRFQAAAPCYQESLVLARAVRDRQLEGTIPNNLSGIYQNLGEPGRQAEYLGQALALRRETGDTLGEAITLNNLGAFHRGLGEVEDALLHYHRALTLFEKLGEPDQQAAFPGLPAAGLRAIHRPADGTAPPASATEPPAGRSRSQRTRPLPRSAGPAGRSGRRPGFLNPQTPELSGLMLSRRDAHGAPLDGFLSLHDVANLELSADLVVLSGCQTALGKEVRGEGLVGLTRGFQYAGVPRVVASLWQVRDRATAELMEHFYRTLLEEHPPDMMASFSIGVVQPAGVVLGKNLPPLLP